MKNTTHTHNSVEFERFYSDSIPTIRKIGYIAQIISGGSAGFAIFSMAYPKASIWGSLPAVMISAALMLLIVFMFEGGLRKFLPIAVKQIIHSNWNSRWWVAMFVPLAMISVFFLFGTSLLSWKAAPEMVQFATPELQQEDESNLLIVLDSLKRQDESVFESDKSEIESLVREEIAALTTLYKGKIKTKKKKAASVKESYPGWSAGLYQKVKELEGERNQAIADAKGRKTTMIAAIKEKKTASLLLHSSQQQRAMDQLHNRNTTKYNKFESSIGLWSGLGKWFCLFCSFIALACIAIEQIYERGRIPGTTQKGPALIPISSLSSNPRDVPDSFADSIKAQPSENQGQSTKQESKQEVNQEPIPVVNHQGVLVSHQTRVFGEMAIIEGLMKGQLMNLSDMKARKGGYDCKLRNKEGLDSTNKTRSTQLGAAIRYIEKNRK